MRKRKIAFLILVFILVLFSSPAIIYSAPSIKAFKVKETTDVYSQIARKKRIGRINAGTILFPTDSELEKPYKDGLIRTNVGLISAKKMTTVEAKYTVYEYSMPPGVCTVSIFDKVFSCENHDINKTSPRSINVSELGTALLKKTSCDINEPEKLVSGSIFDLFANEISGRGNTDFYFISLGDSLTPVQLYILMKPWCTE